MYDDECSELTGVWYLLIGRAGDAMQPAEASVCSASTGRGIQESAEPGVRRRGRGERF